MTYIDDMFYCISLLHTCQISLRATEHRKLIAKTKKSEVAIVRFAQRNRDLSDRNRQLEKMLISKTKKNAKEIQKEATKEASLILKKRRKEATKETNMLLKKHRVSFCNKKRDLGRIESAILIIAKQKKEKIKFV